MSVTLMKQAQDPGATEDTSCACIAGIGYISINSTHSDKFTESKCKKRKKERNTGRMKKRERQVGMKKGGRN